eukprot:4807974-Pyramimonas_sp.AAC.1
MNWGGPMCQAWCPGGGQHGMAHKSISSFNMWIEEAKRFDIVLMEESDQFPMDLMIAGLSQTHKVIFGIFSPTDLGWPTARSRVRAAALRYERLIWLGPDGPNVTNAFLSIYREKVVTTASVFCQLDTPDAIKRNLKEQSKQPRAMEEFDGHAFE